MRITLDRKNKLWFTSDTHYSHKNICAGTTEWDRGSRPFKTLEQMNERLIKNINDNVGENDHLVHLGDWSFGGEDQIEKFRQRIICKNIHIILGNHDQHIKRNRYDFFSSINSYEMLTVSIPSPMVYGKQEKSKRLRFVLSHFPIASWDSMGRGVFHLHGHIHAPHENKLAPGRMMDVGVDGHPEFRPYELSEVVRLLRNRPIKGLLQRNHDKHL